MQPIQPHPQVQSIVPPPSDEDLEVEFRSLREVGVEKSTEESNGKYNVFENIRPYDDTRVKIENLPDFYYNANWVLGGDGIACVGPTKENREEFLDMLWELEPSVVVMLVRSYEVESYWDTKKGPYSAQCSKQTLAGPDELNDEAAYIIKREITLEKGGVEKHFVQLYMKNWPDRGVVSPSALKKLVELVDEEKQRYSPGPILAHCRAGIGRTGTFFAAFKGFRDGSSDLFEIVKSLRNERMKMVQNPDQYILAKRTIDSFLT